KRSDRNDDARNEGGPPQDEAPEQILRNSAGHHEDAAEHEKIESKALLFAPLDGFPARRYLAHPFTKNGKNGGNRKPVVEEFRHRSYSRIRYSTRKREHRKRELHN